MEDKLNALIVKAKQETRNLPPYVVPASAFAAGVLSIVGCRRIYVRNFRRITNSDWITPDVFKRKKWIKGVVTSVGDSDNFRLYHTPAFGWRWPLKFRRIPSTVKELKDMTIHIRLAGVDAPEAAHFGRPAQPYSAEALAWIKKEILGKRVYCQLYKRDQYSRIVAAAYLSPRILPGTIFTGKSISLEMMKAGWVTIYEQAGAEYGSIGKERYLAAEAQAKASRRGMWEHGVSAESPAEYKRRHAKLESSPAQAGATKTTTTTSDSQASRTSWFSRLFRKSP